VRTNAEDLLNNLYEKLRKPQEEIPPPIFKEIIFLEKILGYYKKIKVKIRFIDSNNQSQELQILSEIYFSNTLMQIIARKLSHRLEREKKGDMEVLQVMKKNYNYFKNGEIITLNEENFHQILDLAEELNIKWYLLMNLNFNLKKISCLAYKPHREYMRPRTINLWLVVETRHEPIVLILEKIYPSPFTPAPSLVQIEKIIKEYGKGVLTKENLYLINEFFF
jgi:hypothetical protein